MRVSRGVLRYIVGVLRSIVRSKSRARSRSGHHCDDSRAPGRGIGESVRVPLPRAAVFAVRAQWGGGDGGGYGVGSAGAGGGGRAEDVDNDVCGAGGDDGRGVFTLVKKAFFSWYREFFLPR